MSIVCNLALLAATPTNQLEARATLFSRQAVACRVRNWQPAHLTRDGARAKVLLHVGGFSVSLDPSRFSRHVRGLRVCDGEHRASLARSPPVPTAAPRGT